MAAAKWFISLPLSWNPGGGEGRADVIKPLGEQI